MGLFKILANTSLPTGDSPRKPNDVRQRGGFELWKEAELVLLPQFDGETILMQGINYFSLPGAGDAARVNEFCENWN